MTTITLTKTQAVRQVLEENFGRRIPSTSVAFPFSEDDPRKMVLCHRKPISRYRVEHPGAVVTNKKKMFGGDIHSFYMLHACDDGLEKKPLPTS